MIFAAFSPVVTSVGVRNVQKLLNDTYIAVSPQSELWNKLQSFWELLGIAKGFKLYKKKKS